MVHGLLMLEQLWGKGIMLEQLICYFVNESLTPKWDNPALWKQNKIHEIG